MNTKNIPVQVIQSLITLGKHIRIARKRRKDSIALLAERLDVSSPTIRKMEKGDPTVSVAIYAMALWVYGKVDGLTKIADPRNDLEAWERELRG